MVDFEFGCKVTENKWIMQIFYTFMNEYLVKNHIFMNEYLAKNYIFMNESFAENYIFMNVMGRWRGWESL